MKLTWNGHSCFTLETAEGSVVLDPYADGQVPGLAPLRLRADMVLCSHEHRDHNAREVVTLTGNTPAFGVETISTFHDPENGALRGENTIHIVTAEGKRIVHMGDIGHPLSAEQARAVGTPDVLMIPVGGYYTVDAVTAKGICDALKPRTVVPMHYRGPGFGYDVIAPVTDFTALFDRVTVLATNILDLNAAPSGVVVLRCPVN